MNGEVRSLLKARDAAFRAGDEAALKTARKNLSQGIKTAKRQYTREVINSHFTNNRDARRLWQGIQAITDYKAPPQVCDSDPSLPDQLNYFYARFEALSNTPALKVAPQPDEQALSHPSQEARNTRKVLSWINPSKAAGPDKTC